MQFIIRGGIALAKGAAPLVKYPVQQAIRRTPQVLKPIYEGGRAFVMKAPRRAALGNNGGYVSTIYPSTRIGLQLRRGIESTAYAALIRTPKASAAIGRRAITWAIRDTVITPLSAVIYRPYAFFRGERYMRGATSLFERYADKIIIYPVKVLQRFGLAPTMTSDIFSATRLIIYGGIYAATDRGRRTLDRVDSYVSSLATQYQGYSSRIRSSLPTAIPVDVQNPTVRPIDPVLVAPAPPPPVIVPNVPAAPAQPPQIITPQIGRRRR